MTYVVERPLKSCPVHPGAVLSDVIEDIKLSRAEIARMMGISKQHLGDICSEKKGVTTQVALRLAKLFGTDPMIWISPQAAHDIWNISQTINLDKVIKVEF